MACTVSGSRQSLTRMLVGFLVAAGSLTCTPENEWARFARGIRIASASGYCWVLRLCGVALAARALAIPLLRRIDRKTYFYPLLRLRCALN